MTKSAKKLWPFVLKSTAIEAVRKEQVKGDERVVAEQTRILFMKYDELFKDLAPLEVLRFSEIEVAGFALVDRNMKPMAMRSFLKLRHLVVGDELTISLYDGSEISPRPHRHDDA